MHSVSYCFLLLVYVYGQQTALGLGQGEICKDIGKDAWTCEHLKNCTHIGDFKKNIPTICSFDGIEPIICCPPSTNSSNTTTNCDKGKLISSNGNANRSEICKNIGKKACTCEHLKNCTQIGDFKKKMPTIYSFDGIEPIMCCPPSTNSSNSTRKCDEGKLISSNGINNRIAGGKVAEPREHKYMVLIGYGAGNSKSWGCGGSLISERWVLSAAHCANPKSQGPAQWARVGDLDISSTAEDARPQEKRIVQRIIHPDYKNPAVYNDIALFKLNSAVIFNDWVAPIYLQTDRVIEATKATITGWGRAGFVGDVSAQLQEVEMTLVDGEECRRLYNDSLDSKIPRGIEVQAMICAGEREGGKSACAGDSGGPLVIKAIRCCPKTQIGISSFGRECALPNTPGVYTRVSQYIPWIESIVWPK